MPFSSWKYPFLLFLVTLLAALAGPSLSAQAFDEGFVEYEIEYEDVGATAAFLPKTEAFYFRPGQTRSEFGSSAVLTGVEPGREIHLMELPGHRLAFSVPEVQKEGAEDLRVEPTEEKEEIAGETATVAYLVDIRDPSNRLPVLLSDRIQARKRGIHPDLEGFALAFYRQMQTGLGHWRATEVSARDLEDTLFQIPEGFQRLEVESTAELPGKIRELMDGDVEVLHQ